MSWVQMPKLHILTDPGEAAQAAAELVASLVEESVSSRGRFTVALSGGSTPRRPYQLLASPPYKQALAWDRWHVFWGDERCVPPDNKDSNYRMAKEELLDRVPIAPAHISRMRGDAVPEIAAEEYETLLGAAFRDRDTSFDLLLLGIGEDGHTASLFPGTAAVGESSKLVMANWVPRL